MTKNKKSNKKSETKIVEIASKIKEIKPDEKNESKLEKEVDKVNSDIVEEEFAPSGNFQAPILTSNESSQENSNGARNERVRAEPEPEFSQTRAYSQTTPLTAEQAAAYVSPEDAVRRVNPSISQTNINFNPTRRAEDFHSDELVRMRGERGEKGYASPLDVQQEKPKRKYPWEV